MKYLGIDYGSKRVGIAASDEGGSIAFPRVVIDNTPHLIEDVLELMKKEGASAVVIGDTRGSGGSANPVTKEAESFAEELVTRGVAVERVWELWSSIEASRYAEKGNEHEDSAAAAIILQRFLDIKIRSGDHSPKNE